MTFLSNVEIEALLSGSSPPIAGIAGEVKAAGHQSALEAASVRLTVGRIYQLEKDSEERNQLVEQKGDTIIKEGGVVLVLTEEVMNFGADLGGLMTAKSGGMAERGILITNTGHVDPGYQGRLRFVVINMGHEPFCLRKKDVIAKLMLFRLSTPSSPKWSDMHNAIPDPDTRSVRSLGYDFLNIEQRAAQIAESKAKEVVKDILISYGIPGFAMATLASCALGIIAVAITFAVGR